MAQKQAAAFQGIGNLFSKNNITKDIEVSAIESLMDIALMVPEDSSSFWKDEMTRDMAYKWSTENPENHGNPQCLSYLKNLFSRRFSSYSNIFNKIDKEKNLLENWQINPNLIPLLPKDFSVADRQDLSDQGVLVLMTYDNPNKKQDDHFAALGNSGLTLFSIPTKWYDESADKIRKNPNQNIIANTRNQQYPILVQAGTYTGVITIPYGMNYWTGDFFTESDTVRFYAVRK